MKINIFSPNNRTLFSRLLGFLLLALLAVSSGRWHEQSLLVEHLLWVSGWIAVGIGALGRIWCSTYISGFKNTLLVTEGPYSISRNPLYLFSFIAGLGVMLLTETLLFPALFAVFYLLYYRGVIRQEEAYLVQHHQVQFQQYVQQVPRFFPKLGLYHEPSSYVVSPPHIRRFLGQVIWFFWIAAIIQVLEELRLQNILPTYFSFY